MPQVSYCEAAQADEDTDTDADLVMQLRAGDESAIAQLVDQWSPTMLRVARSFVGSPQSAEDVVQEAWLGDAQRPGEVRRPVVAADMDILDPRQPGQDSWCP